ncbi:Membrane-associated zinc metalloprotease [hydrothermal vent metagenome]|uniref:Membrane-associated zinc metalloprotease n=1 Tax=hydrothermal vent metagenome TaxID=652676 RepID=A0A1W1C6P4_9ZZZZ
MSWFIAFLVLSFLIFFHELGHYLAAKLMGVYVEVFSIGFGPKLASFRAFGNEWRFSAIFLGGYVKMKGQDDSDPTKKSLDPDSYTSKNPFQRIFILFAGPFANFVIAYIFFFAIALGGPVALEPVIGDVLKNSPAQKAGLQKHDKVIAINGKKVSTWSDMAKEVASSKGALEFQIERGGYIEFKTITPELRDAKNEFNEKIKRRMIGISSAGVVKNIDLGVIGSLKYAWNKTIWASTMIFKGVEKLITGAVPAKELGGVVTIVKITADAANSGWMAVLFFAALISVNLGVLNLLPIPALDGGHIMFNLYEIFTHKAPSEEMLYRLTVVGWVILFGLMGLGLYNDINRLMGS